MTYGDGVSDVNIRQLLDFHTASGLLATLTAVRPPGRFGALELDDDHGGCVSGKARRGRRLDQRRLLRPLARAYSTTSPATTQCGSRSRSNVSHARVSWRPIEHEGFWQPMDTLRDKRQLEELWRADARRGRRGERRREFWRGRRVLVTGHTGFKGAWLSPLARRLGARVTGFALPPADHAQPVHAGGRRAADRSQLGDVRDLRAVDAAMARSRPEIVFHLAAQSLVRQSICRSGRDLRDQRDGTVHVLDAARRTSGAARGRDRHQRQVLREPGMVVAAIARTTPWAATTRTAAARAAPSW